MLCFLRHNTKHTALIEFERQFEQDTVALQETWAKRQKDADLSNKSADAIVLDMRDKLKELQVSLQSAETVIKTLQNQVTNSGQELSIAIIERDTLEEELNVSSKEKEELRDELSAVSAEFDSICNAKHALESENAALEQELAYSSAEVERLNNDLASAPSSANSVSSSETQHLQEENQKLWKDVRDAKDQLQTVVEKHEQERASLQMKLAQTQGASDRAGDDANKSRTSLSEAVTLALGECLRKAGAVGDTIPDTLPTDPKEQLNLMVTLQTNSTLKFARHAEAAAVERAKLTDMENRVAELNTQLSEARGVIDAANTTIKNSASEAREEQAQFNEMMASVRAGFDREKVNFDKQIASAQRQSGEFEATLQKARKDLISKEDALSAQMLELQEYRDKCASAESERNIEKKHRVAIEEQIDGLRNEVADKAGKLARCQAELSTAQDQHQSLGTRIGVLEADLDEAQEQITENMQALDASARAHADLKADATREHTQAQKQIQSMALEASRLQAEARQVQKELKEELAQEKAAVRQLEGSLNKAAREVDLLNMKLEQAGMALDGAKTKHTTLDDQLEKANRKERELTTLKQQLDAARQMNHEDGARHSQVTKKLRDQYEDLQSRLRRQERQLKRESEDKERVAAVTEKFERASAESIRQYEKALRRMRGEIGQCGG